MKPKTLPSPVKDIAAQQETEILEESPWRDSQLAKFRRQAQEVLSQVIEKQKLLESKNVHLWANDAFEQLIVKAEQGDDAYRKQNFNQAIDLYQSALRDILQIEASMPAKFEHYLKLGEQALINNDAEQAKEQLQIAMYLQAKGTYLASQLFDRALVLDQILILVKNSDGFIAEQKFKQAAEQLKQALTLDQQSLLVKENLAKVEEEILSRDFSLSMSTGYGALKKQKYQQALKAFATAKKLKPKNSAVLAAIKQAENEQLQAQVNHLLKGAQQYDQQEKWQLALAEYEKVLVLDKSIMVAQVGLLKAKARLTLEQSLISIIEQPSRLSNQAVLQQAKLIKNDALKVKIPGDKLNQQIEQISEIIALAQVPVAITIESDNQTLVTLIRKGQLGKFKVKELNLVPGEYTLVGSKNGFRDVRQNFTLAPAQQHQTIVIECNEKISIGGV